MKIAHISDEFFIEICDAGVEDAARANFDEKVAGR